MLHSHPTSIPANNLMKFICEFFMTLTLMPTLVREPVPETATTSSASVLLSMIFLDSGLSLRHAGKRNFAGSSND